MVLVLIRLLFVYVGSFTLKIMLCFFSFFLLFSLFFLPEVGIYMYVPIPIVFSKIARLRT